MPYVAPESNLDLVAKARQGSAQLVEISPLKRRARRYATRSGAPGPNGQVVSARMRMCPMCVACKTAQLRAHILIAAG